MAVIHANCVFEAFGQIIRIVCEKVSDIRKVGNGANQPKNFRCFCRFQPVYIIDKDNNPNFMMLEFFTKIAMLIG